MIHRMSNRNNNWLTAPLIHNMKLAIKKNYTESASEHQISKLLQCLIKAAIVCWKPTYSKGKGKRRVSYRLSKDVCPAVYYMNDKYKN